MGWAFYAKSIDGKWSNTQKREREKMKMVHQRGTKMPAGLKVWVLL